ncbi:MAG: ketol-acid reductoisomerase [candidate division Zixibacteria bacterium]|nr:ketol-acid reductoisomerase [candidate division Zixibacteria bacterium]
MTLKIYKDKHANLKYLKGKTITILGYGSQGRAQAANLKDSGCKVIVGLRAKSKNKKSAQKDGFEILSIEKAVQKGDIISFLIPDHIHSEVFAKIKKYLSPGKTLLFAHGFSIHFKLIRPPKNVDVILVAPHSPGKILRENYKNKKGVTGFVGVYQDYTGEAKKVVLAYAKGVGLTKAGVFWTSFKDEAVGDIFGEQAVLCGGLTELLKKGFEVLTQAGLSKENAYLECIHQLDFIVNLIKSYGISGMYNRISKTAEYGSYLSGKRVIDDKVKQNMKKVLAEIKNGAFARKWIREYKAGMKNYIKLKKQVSSHPLEKTGESLRRKLTG